MDDRPTVVILSTHEKDGSAIIKGILGKESLDEPSVVVGEAPCWEWQLDNKYYRASLLLAKVPRPHHCRPWINATGEALLLYCDATQNDALDCINNLVEKLGDFEPEVQILVCDSCPATDTNGGLSRLSAQQWCISNGWELVELNGEVEPEEDEEEDDFPESFGFKRICQALNAHTWSNLVMKDNKSNRLNAVLQSVAAKDSKGAAEESDEVLYSQLTNLDLEDSATTSSGAGGMLDPSLMDECLDEGTGDFENLFSSFEQLKRTASSLPPEQRRDYAEKVAVAFWRAMGGSDDDIAGLDSD